jgi:hypothetical protein
LRILRKLAAELFRDDVLEAGDNGLPIAGGKIGVEHCPGIELVVLNQLLEMMMLDAEHDLSVHLDEAAVAVIGEALVAALSRHPGDGAVVETEVQDGIHHPRHRDAGAGADRYEERVFGIAKATAELALEVREALGDLFLEPRRIGFAVGVEVGADLGRDREAGRHRQAEPTHLGQSCPLAAEQVAHVGPPLGGALAEAIDPLSHAPLTLRFARNRRPGSGSRGSGTIAGADSRAVSVRRN